jgi:hypothetical protein
MPYPQRVSVLTFPPQFKTKASYSLKIGYLYIIKLFLQGFLPPAEIFLFVMEWANISTIFVPKIGLVDGIIHQMYEEIVAR